MLSPAPATRRGSWNAGQRVNSESRAEARGASRDGSSNSPTSMRPKNGQWIFLVFQARTQLLDPCYGLCLGLGREGVDALWSQGPTTIKTDRQTDKQEERKADVWRLRGHMNAIVALRGFHCRRCRSGTALSHSTSRLVNGQHGKVSRQMRMGCLTALRQPQHGPLANRS